MASSKLRRLNIFRSDRKDSVRLPQFCASARLTCSRLAPHRSRRNPLRHLPKVSRPRRRESNLSLSKPSAALQEPSLILASIVAVHGLNGHRDKTWTAANGTHWLRDILPADIPNARVFCWGYDANTHGDRVSCQYLYDHATQLVSDLCLERRLTKVWT